MLIVFHMCILLTPDPQVSNFQKRVIQYGSDCPSWPIWLWCTIVQSVEVLRFHSIGRMVIRLCLIVELFSIPKVHCLTVRPRTHFLHRVFSSSSYVLSCSILLLAHVYWHTLVNTEHVLSDSYHT